MGFSFYVEFTAEDRIKFEPKLANGEFKSLRVKYQSAKKSDKVNYSMVGFDPFFEYEWITVVKYDNVKGEAVKDLMRPTPVTYSPHGLHVKESWGQLDNRQFIAKVMEDMKNWEENRIKYDIKFSQVDNDRRYIGDHNLVKATKMVNFLFNFGDPEAVAAFNNIYEAQTLINIPEPQEDEWLLEQNSIAAHRVEKRAFRGDPDIIFYGPYKVLTFQRSGEEPG